MKRGDIFYANLSPTIGSEVAKTRPVLIVSNDINNRVASTITVLPITSKVTKVYPFEVFIGKGDSGLSQDSKIQAQQIRTIAKERLQGDVVGSLSQEVMKLVNLAVNLHLGLA
ncbi:type II toxin-antitoxin system PemK/MazF family toxin (plasmid) [Cyanobacterium sp. IPPAS B-1200]|uniref:type II toxin-antitoxin system PemK/MazF family toxin n=1 Tax=Cyanobacterium sp. IPPAS B-1200 TaxID=1562720 RepID=UPI0008526811|nr:type II toxin-antitoxin system PemK/MazF family toxin [Cyanobacterium sp. IPPAS B-1200]OEJ78447.1 MazF family transcriptional regulator [Cyanobacterium sp. IPPAS B-1200]